MCVFEVWPAPGGPGKPSKIWGAKPPTFLRAFPDSRGRPDFKTHPKNSGQTAFRYPEQLRAQIDTQTIKEYFPEAGLTVFPAGSRPRGHAPTADCRWVLGRFVRRSLCVWYHGPKPYKLIGFGDIYGPKPYNFTGFGNLYGPKPYKCTCLLGSRLCCRGLWARERRSLPISAILRQSDHNLVPPNICWVPESSLARFCGVRF